MTNIEPILVLRKAGFYRNLRQTGELPQDVPLTWPSVMAVYFDDVQHVCGVEFYVSGTDHRIRAAYSQPLFELRMPLGGNLLGARVGQVMKDRLPVLGAESVLYVPYSPNYGLALEDAAGARQHPARKTDPGDWYHTYRAMDELPSCLPVDGYPTMVVQYFNGQDELVGLDFIRTGKDKRVEGMVGSDNGSLFFLDHAEFAGLTAAGAVRQRVNEMDAVQVTVLRYANRMLRGYADVVPVGEYIPELGMTMEEHLGA